MRNCPSPLPLPEKRLSQNCNRTKRKKTLEKGENLCFVDCRKKGVGGGSERGVRRSVVRVRVFGLVLGVRAAMEPNNARGSDASRADKAVQYLGIYKCLSIQRVIHSMSGVRAAPFRTNNLHTVVRITLHHAMAHGRPGAWRTSLYSCTSKLHVYPQSGVNPGGSGPTRA